MIATPSQNVFEDGIKIERHFAGFLPFKKEVRTIDFQRDKNEIVPENISILESFLV